LSILGTWEVSVTTPFCAQTVTLEFTDETTGVARYGADSVPLENVSVSGDSATCSVKLTQPMAVTLKCAVTVEDDAMSGTASAGFFGKFALTGRRTSNH
jgi:hypothetical protein